MDGKIGHLEEMKGCNKSSSPSTPTSGTNTTDGGNSSLNSSPKSLVKRCHPIHTVIVETQVKGNLVDRLLQLEERVLQLEHEIESEKKEEEKRRSSEKKMKNSKNGFKGLVKSCMPRSQKP
ncbi:hypothetical protein CKAN_01155900 [Cinnamomum micranthum f. kanehirae]|uniref:Uncharacterized protein n=1 Tax=Cinnamomum micranthum f. kanehirae TaxID=337451 RepID=A0A443NWF0_9MAGN|nr:hypothetical protein CKAN_01155900 [Cinnamomum micranthum f. kanehirae]